MKTVLLKIKADLQNCTELKPLDHKGYPHDYGFKFQCDRCKFTHPKEVIINRFDRIPIAPYKQKNSTKEANFFIYCKDCENPIFIILTPTERGLQENHHGFMPILQIHCHGCIITEFILEDQFQCTANSGEIIDEVDLRTNEWTEFDETTKVPMIITNFQYDLEPLHQNSLVTTL